MLGLFRDKYADFTVKHFHEQLVKRHNYKLCYTVTKASLQAAGLVAKARRRSAHRSDCRRNRCNSFVKEQGRRSCQRSRGGRQVRRHARHLSVA